MYIKTYTIHHIFPGIFYFTGWASPHIFIVFFGVIIRYPVTFGVANQRNSPQGPEGPQGPFRKSPGSSSSGPCTWFTCRSKCRRPTNRSALVPGPGWAMSKVGSGKFEDEENGTKGGKEPRFFDFGRI